MIFRIASADPDRRRAAQRLFYNARFTKTGRAIDVYANIPLNRRLQLSQRRLRKSHLSVHRFLLVFPMSFILPSILLRCEIPVNAVLPLPFQQSPFFSFGSAVFSRRFPVKNRFSIAKRGFV